MNFNRLKNYLSDGATLSASYPKGWTSAVVADNENPNCIVHNTEEKMIRKSLEVYATNVTLANSERFGLLNCSQNKMP